jgi:hypothetical protein
MTKIETGTPSITKLAISKNDDFAIATIFGDGIKVYDLKKVLSANITQID